MVPQLCDDASYTVLVENNGVAPEHGLQPNFQVAPLFSTRRVLVALSQSCYSVDSDARCKRALTEPGFSSAYLTLKHKKQFYRSVHTGGHPMIPREKWRDKKDRHRKIQNCNSALALHFLM